jgi:hypothetical protein
VEEDFLDSLRTSDAKSYLWFRERHAPALEEHGPSVGEPLWKSLGDGLFEIRWNAKHRGHARIYCSPESDRRIVCYMGEVKHWGAFAHRKICLARRDDYLSVNYDLEKRNYLYRSRAKGKNNGTV